MPLETATEYQTKEDIINCNHVKKMIKTKVWETARGLPPTNNL